MLDTREQQVQRAEVLHRTHSSPLTKLIPGLDVRNIANTDSLSEILEVEGRKQNEFLNSWQGSVSGGDNSMNEATYAESLLYHLKSQSGLTHAIDELRTVFAKKVLVDLGAGLNSYGYEIANMLQASAYIGVDLFHAAGLAVNVGRKAKGRIPFAVVPEDALTFIRRIPEGTSVNFLCAGLDEVIITKRAYIRDMVTQMESLFCSEAAGLMFHTVFLPRDMERVSLKTFKVTGGPSREECVFLAQPLANKAGA